MKVQVYYRSAAFRQAAGVREEIVERAKITVAEALAALIHEHGESLRRLLFLGETADSLRCFILINGSSVRNLDAALADGDRLEILGFSAGG